MNRPWPPRDEAAYTAEALRGLDADLVARLRRVRALVFDCDGVLTDGLMHYGPDGEAFKAFHAHDGLGMVLARAGGLRLALLTGRRSEAAARRCTELRFDVLKLGRFDKQAALLEICRELDVAPDEVLYLGDDLIDIPALDLAGVPCCVPAAPADVRGRCLWATTASGGAGAAREAAELVLKAQGRFAAALAKVGERAWLPRTAGEEEPA
ncbi:MAG TPA: HAD hydrolase family protein [Candidatus Krumholzibacteria bacterium]|nr:HAD hydrolase family protein [Candidatus Krumholzibacteria bacterium]HRX50380.1 HAD hydrolase family protein [Candidatus Krumholzibacteria bacterium]